MMTRRAFKDIPSRAIPLTHRTLTYPFFADEGDLFFGEGLATGDLDFLLFVEFSSDILLVDGMTATDLLFSNPAAAGEAAVP